MDKLDKFHVHEAIDRAYCIMEMVNILLAEHPAIQQGGFGDRVNTVIDELWKLYQDIGMKYIHFDEEGIK